MAVVTKQSHQGHKSQLLQGSITDSKTPRDTSRIDGYVYMKINLSNSVYVKPHG